MVLTAEHPEPAGRSAMEHWLLGAGGSPTVPPDYGILLTATRRMHPLTTEFISQAFYEGRLTTHDPSQQDQRVVISAPDEDAYTASPLQALFAMHIDGTSYSTTEADLIAEVVARLVRYGEVSTHGGPMRKFRNTSKDGDAPHEEPDILIVAPYSAQVHAIEEALARCMVNYEGLDPRPYAQVMTTDKAQGKTAAVVIYSLVRSSVQGARRGSDFLLSPNRFNVAISRARALSLLVCSWTLPNEIPQSPEHAKNLNPLKLYLEMASQEILGDPRKDESS
jgi:superfamily I DNA and/or RNA helicase